MGFILNPYRFASGVTQDDIIALGPELYLEGSSFVGVLSDGDDVGQWDDLSGNSNDFIQGSAPSRPHFRASGTGGLGKPCVEFDAADLHNLTAVLGTNWSSGFTAGEMFVVTEVETDPPGTAEKAGPHIDMGGGSFQSHHPFTDGKIYEAFGNTTRPDTGNPTPALTDWHLYNARMTSAGALSTFINGTSHFSTTGLTVSFSRTPRIGAGSVASGARYYDGSIAFALVFDRVLSSGDRTVVHDYVSDLYSLTIA